MADNAGPKYRAIAGDLRAAIQRGQYPAGARLPGENDLMREYQVARMTARQALALLINEGLAWARKGSGVYVREFQPIVRDGIARLGPGTWSAGRSIWTDDIDDRQLRVDQVAVRAAEPPDHVRLLLTGAAVPEAEVVVRSRRFVLDGKPVLLSSSYLLAALVADSPIKEADPGPGGIYARLADLGHAPVRFREDLRARMPEPDESGRLELEPGTPVVEIIRTAYTAAGDVVEVNEMTADAAAYVFRYDFESR
jgi:GntR family transcriptional regulator